MAVTAFRASVDSLSVPGHPFLRWRRLASPNKDISSANKSMLTVCLHRLGVSAALWFLIRHMMRRKEIGIWAEDCCMGPTDLIVFAFHLPALMETILIRVSHCHLGSKPSQVENTCISHSYFNKARQRPHKDGGEIIFSLLIEPDVDKALTIKTEDDGENNQMSQICLVLYESIFFSVYSWVVYTLRINPLIFLCLIAAQTSFKP